MIKLQTAGYLNKARNMIVSNATKLGEAIHIHMCECLLHASEHGDVTLCQRLYDELPEGQRKESIKLWFGKMGPITARQGVWKLKEGWKKEQFLLEKAEGSPFWVEFGAERPPRVFSAAAFMAMIQNAPQRMEKAIKEQQEDGQAHFAGDVDASKEFFAELIDFAKKAAEKYTPQALGFETLKPETAKEEKSEELRTETPPSTLIKAAKASRARSKAVKEEKVAA